MNVNATAHLPPASSVAASVITRPELAQLLKVSVRTVDRMIAEGDIRVVHVRGKIVRILKADVEEYLGRKS